MNEKRDRRITTSIKGKEDRMRNRRRSKRKDDEFQGRQISIPVACSFGHRDLGHVALVSGDEIELRDNFGRDTN